MRRSTVAVTVLLSLLGARVALANGEIGYVKVVTGTATVVRDGNESPLRVGSPLYQDDTLKTGKDSSLGLTMRDGTTLSAGPETELLLDEYVYAPKAGELGFITRVSQGTLEFVSGMLGKLAPESVSVETPTGVIGMRGTHFLVRVDPGQKFPDGTSAKRSSTKPTSSAKASGSDQTSSGRKPGNNPARTNYRWGRGAG